MPLLIDQDVRGNQVQVIARGRLTDDDFQDFVPRMEDLIEHRGHLRVMCIMDGFRGWNVHGLWDDLKFSLKHRNDFERLAVVAERPWHKWAVRACKPLTSGKLACFDRDHEDEARAWIHSG